MCFDFEVESMISFLLYIMYIRFIACCCLNIIYAYIDPALATVKEDREYSGIVPKEQVIKWVLDELTKLGIRLEAI